MYLYMVILIDIIAKHIVAKNVDIARNIKAVKSEFYEVNYDYGKRFNCLSGMC